MIPRTRASVLIVEDEGIIAQNIQETLTGLGYDAFGIASSSAQAVALSSERCPDVVLMDIRLKGEIDGVATAALLRERFDVPIIYLTAHADDATVERAKQTEPYAYLVKPVKPQELHSAIEIALYKHAMDRRLRERERWFSTTVRSIADAVITVDLAGKVTFMNAAAESLLGVTLESARGRLAREVLRVHGVDLPAGEGPLDLALREKRPVQFPALVLKAAGTSRAIADSAAPVMDDDELLGAVMVFRDVTEQQRLQKQLEVADRLASLGTMAAGVAHEINNPLSAVIGNAEFVLDELRASAGDGSRASQAALDAQSELLSAASRIARIVSDLQAFSRPEPSRSGSVDIRIPIEWAIRSTAHEFRHRARLSTRLDKVPRVDADETKLSQIFVNLLINAAQAIRPGNLQDNEVSIVTRTAPNGGVEVEVTDTGEGIPPETLSRIFEPFFTTKPLGVGTGLGLSICHGLVAAMGGKLEVTSRLGHGTTFRLTLPASAETVASPASTAPPASAGLRGRLLLIDDEDMVLRALARVLGDHEIVATENARNALLRIAQQEQFDVIFCDLMMPNMTGMEFYEELLRLRPELAERVVFLTGAVMTAKVASFLDTVPNRRMHKPFEVDKLRALVQELLGEREREREHGTG